MYPWFTPKLSVVWVTELLCGFSHASLNYQTLQISCHTLSSWMVYHQCEFMYVSSEHLPVWMSCHTLSSRMVSHLYGFFHVSSKRPMWWISFHTLSSWMVSRLCEFFHGSSNYMLLQMFVTFWITVTLTAEWLLSCMDFFRGHGMSCLTELHVTLWTAERQSTLNILKIFKCFVFQGESTIIFYCVVPNKIT